MKVQAALALSMVLLAPSVVAQSAEAMQKHLATEAEAITPWGSDKVFVAAVKAQNSRPVTLAEIQRIDKEWMEGKREALVKDLTTNPCAVRLKQLVSERPAIGESFVMDDQGALVCASEKTSDYWQGDEAKWQRSYNGGKGALFIDRPKFDDSSNENLAQISFPVLDGSKVIGAITVGIELKKLLSK